MIIPVRVAADARPVLAGRAEPFPLPLVHPLRGSDCPACGLAITRGGECLVQLVLVGIHPHDRKPAGFVNGGAVVVHAECGAP